MIVVIVKPNISEYSQISEAAVSAPMDSTSLGLNFFGLFLFLFCPTPENYGTGLENVNGGAIFF